MVIAAAASAAAILSSVDSASAQTPIDWTASTGPWITPSNWNPSGPPTIAGNNFATINNAGTAQIAGSDAAESAILDLGQQSGQSGNLQISGGTLTLAEMRVGGRDTGTPGTNGGGTGAVVQTGGAVAINSNTGSAGVQSLYIGDSDLTTGNTANGSWNLSAGSLAVGIAIDDSIILGTGVGAQGTFVQSGGTVTSTGFLTVARRGAIGVYNLSAGTLTTTADIFIGDGEDNSPATGANGSFIQTGGTVHSVTTTLVGRRGGTGFYSINGTGATLTADTNLNVGNGGTGTFVQGSTLTPTNVAVISKRSMSVGIGGTNAGLGNYTLNSGTMNVGTAGGSDTLAIGNNANGTGTFTQNGGTLTVTGFFNMGRNGSNNQNLYTINAGTLTVTGGGASPNNGGLWIGGGNSATTGMGTFVQNGGVVTSQDDNNIGGGTRTGTTATGTYTLNAGNLNFNKSAGTSVIGNGVGATGTFNQTGGTFTANTGTASLLALGRNSGTGKYSLSGSGLLTVGALTVGGSNTTAVGGTITQIPTTELNGIGSFTQSGTSTVTIANSLNLGLTTTSATTAGPGSATGTYWLQSGTLALSAASGQVIAVANGLGASGSIQQDGGTVSIGANLIDLGRNTGLSGIYNMSAGSLTAGGITFNSATNAGTIADPIRTRTFTTTGGNVTINGTVNFGTGASNAVRSLNINGNANATITTLTMGGTAGNSLTNIGTSGNVTIGTATIGATSRLNETHSAGANHAVRINTLTLTGKLNVGNNKLITRNPVGSATGGTYNGVTGLIQTGYAGSGWGGAAGIITTETNATSNNDYTSIAVASASQVRGIGAAATDVFAGQTVTGSDTLVMYTYGGDANLDGVVDILDYGQIDGAINASLPSPGWFNGDFNYDGVVDILDYGVIDGTINTQGAAFPTGDGSLSSVAVPEPTASLLTLCVAPLLARRKRRR